MKGQPNRHAVIRCVSPTCPGVLGVCTPGAFYPTGCTSLHVVSRVVLACQLCGKKRTWRPVALDHSRE